MSHDLLLAITLATTLGSGLMAGLFFAFSVAIMTALGRIPASSGIAAMQAINVAILNPIFGLVFFGTTLAAALLAGYSLLIWDHPAAVYLLAGGLFHVIGAFVVTMVFNVPRNNALAAVDAANADGTRVWSRYLVTWTAWNHVRTLASLAATASLIVGFSLLRDSGTLLALGAGARPQQLVAIPAPDGGVIQADLYGSGDRAVVLAHGGRFDKSSWQKQARTLVDAGFRVLAIDFRAAVQARAGRETACLYDETCLAVDVLAAVRYLRAKGAKTVAVIGASLGGGAAAQAAVEARDGEIDRVVLLAHMPIKAPERLKGRKLFIVARDDLGSGDVPRLPGIREQFEKAPQPKELVVLNGSEHAQFVFDSSEGERLMREILKFLSAQ